MGIFDKFKIGFKKSASTFTSGLRDIIVKKEIDDKTLDQIEEYLIQSDVGLVAADIKKLVDKKTDIEFALGKLTISIDEKNSIHMKGPVSNIENIELKL